MTPGRLIRPWAEADREPTRAIFNQAVAETTTVWRWRQVDPPGWEAFCQAHRSGRHSFLVAEESGQVVGFAATGPFRVPDGYELTGEDAIYIAPSAQGRGLGRALLGALIVSARAQGLHQLVAAVNAANTASLALHRKLGFAQVGLLPQCGHKFGRWLDLALLQLALDDHPQP
ncbi:MAG: GNAT family N-acetyltransferase [Propionibacteriaceae bacterium]|jgi:phosphinothricin acetyltransferase|nr:GNAT family N-acetyltransferase [Propionibacteriaceae bacterium]